eukprot:TRINITY_DN49037_c0_g1_i1.p1 TRINITY_DN49037_c0_g1~~TRINITY_DN49037_c0_g1_i1.p1  ORF type:complete len:558 (-),score=56.50 TRINITY_DN49037_c0_g1_i1:67-1740(-)
MVFKEIKNIIPETIYGQDSDELFAYVTQKKVWVRDRHLGAFYYLIVVVILGWIVGGQIVWHNEHFQRMDVEGFSRMRAFPNTEEDCGGKPDCGRIYKKLEDLPFCTEFKGTAFSSSAPCKHIDHNALGVGSDDRLFFTTTVETVIEHLTPDGKYEQEPGSHCLAGNYLCSKRGGNDNLISYMADVDEVRIQFTSSYDRDGMAGNSLEHAGFYEKCPARMARENKAYKWADRLFKKEDCHGGGETEHHIPCQDDNHCSRLQEFDAFKDSGVEAKFQDADKAIRDAKNKVVGRKANLVANRTVSFSRRLKTKVASLEQKFLGYISNEEDEDGNSETSAFKSTAVMDVYQNPWGDVFSIGRLLELAGADLDNDYNIDGWSSRQGGTVLEVTAKYNNLYPFLSSFGYTPVKYTYTVKELPMPYVSRTALSKVQPANFPQSRSFENRYGIIVSFKVGGAFGFFSSVYLIVMLTAALGLISVATTVTDLLAQYLHPNFFHLKYDVSPDFSDLWHCEKCGFANDQKELYCQGVEAWKCPKTTPKCGAPKPAAEFPSAEKPSSQE